MVAFAGIVTAGSILAVKSKGLGVFDNRNFIKFVVASNQSTGLNEYGS